MSTRSLKQQAALGRRSLELAVATPQVMAHRLQRMALAGPLPNARDQREFSRMVTEKAAAFTESWAAMMMQAWWAAWSSMWSWPSGLGMTMMKAGLEPVHKRATANARRLQPGIRRKR